MRPTKLIAALVAVTALAAPAGASALTIRDHHFRSHSGPCAISLYAEPHQVASGEQVELFGQLHCPEAASAVGQTVTVYERTIPGAGFTAVGTTATATGGFYDFTPAALTANTAFYTSTTSAKSTQRKVKIAPVVTFVGPAEGTALKTGIRNAVTFSGTVSPADKGASVVLQREGAVRFEEWHTIGQGIVNGEGKYFITHVFVFPGESANLRTVVRANRRYTVRGISNTLSYGISQAENPALTILASSDALTYQSPVTISGVVAGGAGQTVSLLSRPAGTHPGLFTVIATTTAGTGGSYTFPVQTPLISTVYRVATLSKRSTQLYVGVKYTLTTSTAPTTINEGETLKIEGTVTPANPGKGVYLERENRFGGGFHAVDVASVNSEGKFTISYPVFGSGKETFRVRVPGDPSNGATNAKPFSVEVVPSLPAALSPVATQPVLPSEGQL